MIFRLLGGISARREIERYQITAIEDDIDRARQWVESKRAIRIVQPCDTALKMHKNDSS